MNSAPWAKLMTLSRPKITASPSLKMAKNEPLTSPKRSWLNRPDNETPKISMGKQVALGHWSGGGNGLRRPSGASLPERAFALGLGGEYRVARQFLDQFVVVPGLGRFRRFLDLHQVHVMHIAAVGTQLARAEEVVNLHAAPGAHHLVGVHRLGGFDGLEVVHRRRVVGRLYRRGHALGFVEEAGSEFAWFIVHVPVPTGGELQALGVAQAQAVHVGQEDQQTGDLHALADAELFGRLDRVDGVATGG